MENNDVLFDVLHIVGKEHFSQAHHGELYTLMTDIIQAGRVARPTTMMHDMGQDADIGGISASQYLAELLRDAPDRSMARDLARTIRDTAGRRRFIELTEAAIEEAYSAPATITIGEMEARYHAGVSDLFSTIEEAGIHSLADVADSVLDDVEKLAKVEGEAGHRPGLAALEELLGPIMPGRLIALGGAPGAGKTALAMQIGFQVASGNPSLERAKPAETVLFESLEMNRKEVAMRYLSSATKIPSSKIMRATVTPEEFEQLDNTFQAMKGTKLLIHSARQPTVAAIRGNAMRVKRQRGLGLLIVDNFQHVRKDRTLRDEDAMREAVQGLRQIGVDLDCAVILICHLKGSYLSLDKPRPPTDDDMLWSPAVVGEADATLYVYREEYVLLKRIPAKGDKDRAEWEARFEQVKGMAQLSTGKVRFGPGFRRRMVSFEGKTQRFTDRREGSPIPSDDDQLPF